MEILYRATLGILLLAKAQSDSLSGFPNMLTQQNPEMARVSPDPLPILVGVASGHETNYSPDPPPERGVVWARDYGKMNCNT